VTYQVVRPFEGADGRTLQAGETVDVTGWKWVDQLVQQGYIRLVSFAALKPAKKEG
jgi:hypothetical protein